MSDAREELLPCPFCGAPAERIDIDDGENAGGSCISCTQCQASSNVEFEFKENFVSNWNRRAAGYAKPSPAAEAEQEVRTYRHMVEVAMANGFDSLTDAITQAVAARRPANAAEVALGKAADQFAFYADEHAKKGTPEADAKAATNMGWARYCASLTRPAGESAGVAEALTAKGEFRRIGWETVTDEDGATERFFTGDFDFSEPPNWPVKVAWGLPVQITLTPLPPEDAALSTRPAGESAGVAEALRGAFVTTVSEGNPDPAKRIGRFVAEWRGDQSADKAEAFYDALAGCVSK